MRCLLAFCAALACAGAASAAPLVCIDIRSLGAQPGGQENYLKVRRLRVHARCFLSPFPALRMFSSCVCISHPPLHTITRAVPHFSIDCSAEHCRHSVGAGNRGVARDGADVRQRDRRRLRDGRLGGDIQYHTARPLRRPAHGGPQQDVCRPCARFERPQYDGCRMCCPCW